MKLNVLFVYNWVPEHQRRGKFSECATSETIAYIEQALLSFGANVIKLNLFNPRQLLNILKLHKAVDLVFIIAEGFLDEPASMYDGTGAMRLRQILEGVGIPYTHSGVKGMVCCRNKDATYVKLKQRGINIPRYSLLSQPPTVQCLEKAEREVGYPMFVKPNGGGCSIGADEQSIVGCRSELVDKLQQLRGLIGNQTAIAESYLNGREYTVGIIGNEYPIVMPIIAFPEDFTVRSSAVKRQEHQERGRFELLRIDSSVGLKVGEMSLQVFQALPVRDLIRVDIRQDEHNNFFVIDVNGTPSMSLQGSLAFMMESVGASHRDFVGYFLYTVLTRYNIPVSARLEETAAKVRTKLIGDLDDQIA